MRLLVLFFVTFLNIQNSFVEKSIHEGKGSALLPSGFALMGEEMLNAKYPNTSRRPNEVYTDFNGEINITISFIKKKK